MMRVAEQATRAAKLLGKRQAEVLLACVKGDDLLGADYPKQRRQRLALMAKGLIAMGPKTRDGYQPTELGILAAQDLIEMER